MMCGQKDLQRIIQDVIQALLELLEDKIYKVILYGSYARGDFDTESDVDIIILMDVTWEEVRKYRVQISTLASRIGLANDVEVSLLVRDRQTFEKQMCTLPFYQNIQREGIVVYG